MALRIDTSPRYGQMNYDSYPSSAASPQFSDPWSAPGYANTQTLGSSLGLDSLTSKHHGGRTSVSSTSSLSSYNSLPSTTATTSSAQLAGTYAQQDMLGMQNMLSMNRLPNVSTSAYAEHTYTTAPSPAHASYTAPAPYDSLAYTSAPMRSTFAMSSDAAQSKRFSQGGLQDDRRGFASALSSRGTLLPMSDETPRNIYGTRSDRSSTDSYGFPSTHSTSSSMSSNGNFSSYYGDSVSDYSTAGSDIESVTSRSISKQPQGLMTSQPPPAPQSMMGQFSSKVSSSTQKKHKCKVCDKRFMRPSSLQTHMYSHTGEKPFACEVEGCGRHFSVVSNLRRHRKVHKSDARSEACSEDHYSD